MNFTAGGHSGSDAGPIDWSEGIRTEAKCYNHSPCHRW